MSIEFYYIYDPNSGEYLSGKPKRPDKKYSHCTEVPPPETKENETVVWNGKAWEIVPDHRGNLFWDKNTGKYTLIDKIGKLPDHLTEKEPQPFSVFSEKSKEWKFNKEMWLNQYVRPRRNFLLSNSDKYMIPDFPISEKEREKWRIYRQSLRDLPQTIDPKKEKWPEMPKTKYK